MDKELVKEYIEYIRQGLISIGDALFDSEKELGIADSEDAVEYFCDAISGVNDAQTSLVYLLEEIKKL